MKINHDEIDAEILKLQEQRRLGKNNDQRLSMDIRKLQNILKKDERESISGVKINEYKILQEENKRLRGMLAIMFRNDNSATFKAVGDYIGVSPTRASSVIHQQMRALGYLEHKMQNAERKGSSL